MFTRAFINTDPGKSPRSGLLARWESALAHNVRVAHYSGRKIPQFLLANRTRESRALNSSGQLSILFLWRQTRSPVSTVPPGECIAITNR